MSYVLTVEILSTKCENACNEANQLIAPYRQSGTIVTISSLELTFEFDSSENFLKIDVVPFALTNDIVTELLEITYVIDDDGKIALEMLGCIADAVQQLFAKKTIDEWRRCIGCSLRFGLQQGMEMFTRSSACT